MAQFDCDDSDPSRHPGVIESCNSLDDNCDGRIDEQCLVSPVTTTYSYNAFNQLLTSVSGSSTTSFTYDGNGNQLTKTVPGQATTYTWDARDRLWQTQSTGTADPTTCPGDTDCDGVLDASDNCRYVHNPTQQDSDSWQIAAQTGMLAYWNMEYMLGAGTINDPDDEYLIGTLHSGAHLVTEGRNGQALALDGADDHVWVPNVTMPTAALTVAAWFKLDADANIAAGTSHVVIRNGSSNHNFNLRITDGLPLLAVFRTGGVSTTVTSSVPVQPGTWHHIAGVFTGSEQRVYLDGVMTGTVVSIGALRPNLTTEMTCIGGGTSCGGTTFHGLLDDVTIHNRALSTAELARIYATGTGLGDGIGNACDSCINDALMSCGLTTCTDADGDGFGRSGAAGCAGAPLIDCNDNNPNIKPGAVELIDVVDNDCDGRVNEGTGGVVVRYGYDANNLRVMTQDAGGSRRILLDGEEELAEYAAGVAVARYDHDPGDIDWLLGQQTPSIKTHEVPPVRWTTSRRLSSGQDHRTWQNDERTRMSFGAKQCA